MHKLVVCHQLASVLLWRCLWENGFHSRFRDECLACEEFTTLTEAIRVIQEWQMTYNHHRPHQFTWWADACRIFDSVCFDSRVGSA